MERGGGLAILVRHGINCSLTNSLPCGRGTETQAVSVCLSDSVIQVYNIYRPPESDLELDHVFAFASHTNVLVLGDFNAHHTRLCSPQPANEAGRQLFEALDESEGLTLLNDLAQPTHEQLGRLDLSFASSTLSPAVHWSLHPSVTSDHFGILLEITATRPPPPPAPPRFNMRAADWPSFTAIAESLFTDSLPPADLDTYAVSFSDLTLQAARQAIPLCKPHSRPYRDAWIYGPRVRELNHRVNAARKALRARPGPLTLAYLRSTVRHVTAEKQKLRAVAWEEWCQSAGSSTPLSKMWRTVRAMYNPRPPPAPFHPAPLEECERLAAVFAMRSSPAPLPTDTRRTQEALAPLRRRTIVRAGEEADCTDVPFTEDELSDALKGKRDTAAGQDKVTYSMLKRLGIVGKQALLRLINLSWEAGTPPASWKEATIIPIPKPGNPTESRPISLLSCPGKIMERMVLERLRWKLGELHGHLFAFLPRRNTTTCLMTLLGELRSRSGLVIFLDLEKAFELANPLAILETLAEKGIRGALLRWLEGFLTGRSAAVLYQGRKSSLHPHLQGTPQGSCLSPLLFNILMEQLVLQDYGAGAKLLSYADDLALFIPRRDHARAVPAAMRALGHHCQTLGLKLNPAKSAFMAFGFREAPPPPVLLGTALRRVAIHKYLGVWLDQGLTFRAQVRSLRDRLAARTTVLRCVSSRGKGVPVRIRRLIYVTAVRSVVDYCAPCLPGLQETNFSSLEVVQNDAMRAVLWAPRWTKVVALRAELDLPSLRSRVLGMSAVAMATYLQRWSNTRLSTALRQAFQRPPSLHPDGDWVHALADATRAIGLEALAHLDGDTPLPDYHRPPPWCSPHFTIETSPWTRKKDVPTALLRQEALQRLAPLHTLRTRHYFTDGSAGEAGRVGAAFVSGNVTVGHRLPSYASAFQAELAALFLALLHSYNTIEEPLHLHFHTDSLSSLQTIAAKNDRDNLELLSGIRLATHLLYRRGHTISFHWVPGHVGLYDNERADAAAKHASTLEEATFPIRWSLSAIKAASRKAAHTLSARQYEEELARGSRSIRWHYAAAGRTSLFDVASCHQTSLTHISRLRLGYICRSVLFDEDKSCKHCGDTPQDPLLHYLLACPALVSLNRSRAALHLSDSDNAARVVSMTKATLLEDLVRRFPPPN